jgi:DNA-directed RNA polymerase subunit L
MDIEVSTEKNEAEVKFVGEGYTFLNLLRTVLIEDDRVDIATYDVDPHTFDKATLYVKAKERPMDVLNDATSKIISQCNEFKKVFSKKAKL